jgi:hypothetical protein
LLKIVTKLKIIEQGKFARKHPQYRHIKANLPVNQWLGGPRKSSIDFIRISKYICNKSEFRFSQEIIGLAPDPQALTIQIVQ